MRIARAFDGLPDDDPLRDRVSNVVRRMQGATAADSKEVYDIEREFAQCALVALQKVQ
jgi:hypothetical protein